MRSKMSAFLIGCLFLLGSCQSEQTPDMSDTPATDWKIYTHEKYGFSFSYPSNFSVVESNSPANILNIYPENLTECLKRSADGSLCQEELKSPLFGLWNDRYVENDASNPIIQKVHPNYKKLSIGNLDIFKYDDGVPPITVFHINTPDHSWAVELVITVKGEDQVHVAESILRTFSFPVPNKLP